MRRKSINEHKMNGSYREDRHGSKVFLPGGDVLEPEPPIKLSIEGKKFWDDLTRRLSDAKMLSHIDSQLLATFCETYGLWVKTNDLLQKEGLSYITDTGIQKIRPEGGFLKELLRSLSDLTTKLGLSLKDRTQLAIAPNTEDDKDDDYFKVNFLKNQQRRNNEEAE